MYRLCLQGSAFKVETKAFAESFRMSGFYPSVFVNIQKSRHCLCDWKVENFNESEVWRNPCLKNPIDIIQFWLSLFRFTFQRNKICGARV